MMVARAARHAETVRFPLVKGGGGRGVRSTPNREPVARTTLSGRSLGHPATAAAARATWRTTMETTLNPASRLGDLWRLGRHRLICGDATDGATVTRVLAGDRPNLMVTDPPYGVSYDPAWRERALGKVIRAKGQILNDDQADWRVAWALFPGDIVYVWHGSLNGAAVEASLRATGFVPRSLIIWDKGRLIISRGHYHWRHEPCWYAVRRGRTANWQGDRRQMTVWPVPHRRSASGHPTEKPIEIMRRPILNHTRPGDLVYDPFLGSGSTLMAAEETGRICLGVELDPEHCDRIVHRWTASTGDIASREAA